jgi:hypothetical protein
MIKYRRPRATWLLMTLLVVLLSTLVGCEQGNLGLKGGAISGVVVDSRTLVGVADVSVKAISGDMDSSSGSGGDSSSSNKVTKYATTDSNGKYYFSSMRSDEWTLSFDKVGYQPIDETSSATVKVVVVNKETSLVPQVRMVQNYSNQYVMIKGTLKDSISGTSVTYGNTNITVGKEAFLNRMPTEFASGFSVPVSVDEVTVTISVTGYKTMSLPLTNLITDLDLGVLKLVPETYSINGRWTDVPGWVSEAGPTATIYAKSANRVIATATAAVGGESGSAGFVLTGIPRGTSVSIEVEIKGYKLNSPISIYPDADFQGTIYQNLSLKSNFSQIMREVRVYYSNNSINSGDRVGAYCEETGTKWPETTITNPAGLTLGTPQVIDLGTQAVPTGYYLTFVGYMAENAAGTLTNKVLVNDDGALAQIVTIK